MANVPFDIQNYKGQMLGTRPDELPVYINAGYDGNLKVGMSEANGHNVFSTIFGDFIIGHRIPILASAFNQGIPVKVIDYNMTGSSFLYIEDYDFGRGIEKNSVLVNSTGSIAGSDSLVYTTRRLRYLPGHESYAYFTLKWDEYDGEVDAYGGLFDENDGFMLGFYNGVFSYIRRRAGQDIVIPHTEFNGDYDFAKLNPDNINIFAIKFGYLGVAPIEIYVFDPEMDTTLDGKSKSMGKFKLLHQEKYTGTETNPHVINADLPIGFYVNNRLTTNNVAIGTASIEIGNINGHCSELDPAARDGSYVRKGFATTGTSFNIVAFKNAPQIEMIDSLLPDGTVGTSLFNNSIAALLKKIKIVNDGATAVSVDLYIFEEDAITNTPTWNVTDQYYTMLEYSTDITVNLSLAQRVTTFVLNKVDKVTEDIRIENFLLYPGQYAVFVATSNTNMNNTMTFVNTWEEQF